MSIFNKPLKMRFRNFLMFFALTIGLILMLVIGIILYSKTEGFINERKDFINTTRMNQVAGEVSKLFEGVYRIAENLRSNERLIQYLTELDSEVDHYRKFQASKNIEAFLYNIQKDHPFIQTIWVVSGGDQFSSSGGYMDYQLIESNKLFLASDRISLVPIGKAADYLIAKKMDDELRSAIQRQFHDRMLIASPIYDDDDAYPGIIVIVLEPAYFKNSIAGFDNMAVANLESVLFKGKMFDEIELDDAVQAALRSEATGKWLKDKVEIRIRELPLYELKLLYLDENSFHNKQIKLLLYLSCIIFVICVVVAYFLSRLVSGPILFPIHRLIRLLKQYGEDHHTIPFYRDGSGNVRKLYMRDRFFLFFMFTIILPLSLFIVIFYWQSSNITANEMKQSYLTLFEKNSREIDQFISQKEKVLARVSFDQEIQELMASGAAVGSDYYMDKIQSLVNEYRFMGSDKDLIRVFDGDNQLLYSNRLQGESKHRPEFVEAIRSSGKSFSYAVESDEFGNHYISLGMPIRHPNQIFVVIGYVTIRFDEMYVSNLFSVVGGNTAMLLSSSQEVISHSSKEYVPAMKEIAISSNRRADYQMVDGKMQYVYMKQLQYLPWYFLYLFDDAELKKQNWRLIGNEVYLMIILLLLIILLSYTIAQWLMKPLNRLQTMFKSFEWDEWDELIVEEDSMIDEIGQLSRTFNSMIMKIEDLVDETITANREKLKLEYEKKETQIMALQAQINPHFLYNTLDTLLFMMEKNERNHAIQMVTSLSRLFRYVTNKETMLVSMKDEISYAKSYASLMQFRYDNFTCHWDVDDDVLHCSTIKLILQPLIENAVHHGVRFSSDHIDVRVSVKAMDPHIRIIVKDNAAGIPPQELHEIRRQLQASAEGKIGIYNVNARIKLNYGDSFGLDIFSRYGEGTEVWITIPQKAMR